MTFFSMIAGCGGQTLKTVTFTTSAPWTAPGNVSVLPTLSGYGQAGTPEQPGVEGFDTYKTVTVYNSSNQIISGPTTTYEGASYEGSPPADYCEGTYGSQGKRTETCYSFQTFYTGSPATTGASATMTGPSGFSRTFPGGVGGAPGVTTFSNVAVTPNGVYSVNVPAGGSVTITYYE